MIGAALHAVAGVAIAMVSIDLMPRILPVLSAGALIAAFLAGAASSVLLARGVDRLRRAFGSGITGAWMVYVAVAADFLSDGLMTGAGSAVSGSLGLVLALSQVVGNLPGGFATVANFRDEGMRLSGRLLLAASFALPILLGAVLGYALLRGAGPAAQNSVLTFIVGSSCSRPWRTLCPRPTSRAPHA